MRRLDLGYGFTAEMPQCDPHELLEPTGFAISSFDQHICLLWIGRLIINGIEWDVGAEAISRCVLVWLRSSASDAAMDGFVM